MNRIEISGINIDLNSSEVTLSGSISKPLHALILIKVQGLAADKCSDWLYATWQKNSGNKLPSKIEAEINFEGYVTDVEVLSW